MPTDTLHNLGEDIQVHASDPILERKSDMHGWVRVYPPNTPINEWADHSWLLTTTRNADDGSERGITERIKAEAVSVCYERPHFINAEQKYSSTDA